MKTKSNMTDNREIKIKEYANKLLLLFPLELAMWIAKEYYDKQ